MKNKFKQYLFNLLPFGKLKIKVEILINNKNPNPLLCHCGDKSELECRKECKRCDCGDESERACRTADYDICPE